MKGALLRSMLVRLAFTAVMLGVLMVGIPLFFGVLFVEAQLLLSTDVLAMQLVVTAFATLVCVVFATAPFLLLLLVRWNHVRRLKNTLGELGLEGRPLWHNGLQFQGHIGERYAEAFFFRGPMAEFFVEGSPDTRVNVVLDNAIARSISGLGVVEGTPFRIYGEEKFAQDWFATAGVEEALGRMLLSKASNSGVFLRPDGCLVRYRGAGAFSADAEGLRALYDDLATLVEATRDLDPETRLEPNSAEARREPRWGIPFGCVAIPLILPFPFFGAALPLAVAFAALTA